MVEHVLCTVTRIRYSLLGKLTQHFKDPKGNSFKRSLHFIRKLDRGGTGGPTNRPTGIE